MRARHRASDLTDALRVQQDAVGGHDAPFRDMDAVADTQCVDRHAAQCAVGVPSFGERRCQSRQCVGEVAARWRARISR